MSTDSEDAQDRKFARIQREIAVATREQGADPDDNFRLRFALRSAREANMPDEAIDRARKQGTGEMKGPDYKEKTFEGYGPEGVAVFVETITDDPGRTAHELSELFEAHGGNVGEDGCVSWQFARRGAIEVDAHHVDDEDEFMLAVIEMGGEELREPLSAHTEAPKYTIFTDPKDLRDVVRATEESTYPLHAASIVYEPTQHVELEPASARTFLGFFEKLRDHPDVQHAYANWSWA